jgi:hypothetical protein
MSPKPEYRRRLLTNDPHVAPILISFGDSTDIIRLLSLLDLVYLGISGKAPAQRVRRHTTKSRLGMVGRRLLRLRKQLSFSSHCLIAFLPRRLLRRAAESERLVPTLALRCCILSFLLYLAVTTRRRCRAQCHKGSTPTSTTWSVLTGRPSITCRCHLSTTRHYLCHCNHVPDATKDLCQRASTAVSNAFWTGIFCVEGRGCRRTQLWDANSCSITHEGITRVPGDFQRAPCVPFGESVAGSPLGYISGHRYIGITS